MSRNNRLHRLTFGRLSLEPLEARDVPASFTWCPQPMAPWDNYVFTTSAADPQNWVVSMESRERATAAPGPADDLYFDGGWSSASCVIPSSLLRSSSVGLSFESIHLTFGSPPSFPDEPEPPYEWRAYTGTVTIQGSPSISTLEVQCGQIAQADPTTLNPPIPYALNAGTLTVTSSLSWTGGTLNSTAVIGTIALAPGATGIAEPSFTNPGINQTVGLGSTIELLGPAIDINTSLDILSGIYNISNEAGFIVNNQCNLRLLPMPGDTPAPGGGGNQQQYVADVRVSATNSTKDEVGSITVNSGGTVTFEPKLRPTDSTALAVYDAPKGTLKANGGFVQISNLVQAKFGGKYSLLSAEPGVSYTTSYDQKGGAVTAIEAGSQLITGYGVTVWDGFLSCTDRTGASEVYIGATEATAEQALRIGGSAVLDFPGGAPRKLRIAGDFIWSGGEVRLWLGSTTTSCDNLEVTGKVTISNNPTLKLTWSDQVAMADRPRNTVWTLMTSGVNNGITGQFQKVLQTPTNPINAVTMDVTTSDDKKELYARKTSEPPTRP